MAHLALKTVRFTRAAWLTKMMAVQWNQSITLTLLGTCNLLLKLSMKWQRDAQKLEMFVLEFRFWTSLKLAIQVQGLQTSYPSLIGTTLRLYLELESISMLRFQLFFSLGLTTLTSGERTTILKRLMARSCGIRTFITQPKILLKKPLLPIKMNCQKCPNSQKANHKMC